MVQANSFYRILLIFCLIGVVLCVFQYVNLRYQLCSSYLPDMRGQEKNVVYGIQQTMEGISLLYKPTDKPPFAFIQYTPVYYYFCASVCRLRQLRPGQDVLQIYFTCRLVNLLLNLTSCLLLFYLLNRLLGVEWAFAGLAVGLFLLSSQSHTWAIRPDSLKNVLFLSSLVCFFHWIKNKQRILGVLSALFAALAIFTKQDMVALPIAFLLFLWFYGEKKYWTQYVGYLAAFGVLGVGMFSLIYGMAIWENLYWAVNNGSSFSNAKGIISGYIGSYIYLIPFGLFTTVYWFSQETNIQGKLLSILTFVLFLFSCLAASKAGSLIAYFNETNTLIFISIAYFVFEESKKKPSLLLLTTCLSLGILYQALSSYKPEMERLRDSEIQSMEKSHYEEMIAVGKFLRPMLLSTDQIYTNDPFLKNILYRHAILPMDDIVLFNKRSGTFDGLPYTTTFNLHQIKFVVFKQNEPVQDILGQRFENFLTVTSVGSFIIYQKP